MPGCCRTRRLPQRPSMRRGRLDGWHLRRCNGSVEARCVFSLSLSLVLSLSLSRSVYLPPPLSLLLSRSLFLSMSPYIALAISLFLSFSLARSLSRYVSLSLFLSLALSFSRSLSLSLALCVFRYGKCKRNEDARYHRPLSIPKLTVLNHQLGPSI